MLSSANLLAATPTPTLFATSSSIPEYAPGVTPPPNPPLPPFNCGRPTRKDCFWEPDVSKDEYYTCWRSEILYISAMNEASSSLRPYWLKEHRLNSTTDYSYSTTWDPKISFSTLCDGHPRAPPGASPTVVTYTTLNPCTTSQVRCFSYETLTNTSHLPWPTPPACTIPEKECASLSHAWESMITTFNVGGYKPAIPIGLWRAPLCTADYRKYYPQTACQGPSPSRVFCQIDPGEITMLYWPTLSPTHSCTTTGQNQTVVPTTTTHTISGPERTTVYEGKTLTSPTAYIVLPSMRNSQRVLISGHTESGWCGPTQLPPLTLSIPPESVTKGLWKYGWKLTTELVDFRDVETMSYEAFADEMCSRQTTTRVLVTDDCKTVYGEYSPTIIVPQQITKAVEEWEGCNIYQSRRVKKWIPLGDTRAEVTGV